MKPVVLVRGGFVDGSGWEPVYRSLRQAGHEVSGAQHPTQPPILPPVDGFLFLDKAKFAASFADVPADLAAFWADAQLPWGVEALSGQIGDAAWRHKPSRYLVTSEDHMIPPDQQRSMAQRIGATIAETAASHSVFVSHPEAVTEAIKGADNSVT